jgi:hypothetical protein
MDRLMSIVLSNPGATRWAARVVVSVCLALGFLGLRLDRLGGRLARFEVPLPSLDQLLPWWLSPLVPESAAGWLLLIAVGLVALIAGKVARDMERANL